MTVSIARFVFRERARECVWPRYSRCNPRFSSNFAEATLWFLAYDRAIPFFCEVFIPGLCLIGESIVNRGAE
jgi:hypothetical protein